jgi:hypothetical protein
MKRTLALLLMTGCTAFPCFAQEFRPAEPSVLYYVSIPLDGVTRKQKEPVLGFSYQGRRDYQVVRFDTYMLNLVGTGVFEAKWLIVGAVAAGAAVAVGGSDKSAAQQQQQQQHTVQQQAAQQQAQQQPCPKSC